MGSAPCEVTTQVQGAGQSYQRQRYVRVGRAQCPLADREGLG